MCRVLRGAILLWTVALQAQSHDIAGAVKSESGQPLAGMSVTATLLPLEEAEDLTATTTSDERGAFRFAAMQPGRYVIGASAAARCGGSAVADVTSTSVDAVTIVAKEKCRTVSGTVAGAKNAHVIAGRFADGVPELYSTGVRDGHFSIAVPAGGQLVVQALASGHASVETALPAGKDTVALSLERRYETAPEEARRFIAANAIALKTTEAGNAFADMMLLRDVVGSARIVALGEATHGTHEFFQFKHRMLEFLVSQMEFDTFAIEASEPDAMAVDDYVLNGTGSPATVVHNLGFWTWDTEEVVEMVRWMRKWNEDPAHTTKIRFFGFDMQNPAAAQRRLRPWLTTHAPAAIASLDRTEALGKTMTTPRQLTADEAKSANAAITELASQVEAVKPHDEDWRNARHLVDLLAQAVPLAGPSRDPSARDRAMADNIRWIADQRPGSRIVVWAHNGHVSAETYPFTPGGTMGVHLRKMFGDKLVIFGFAFDHGSFRAVERSKGLTDHKVESLDDRSFDHTLATSGPPLFVLDLRKATGAAREWLNAALPMRSIGAVYTDAMPKAYVSRIHPLQSFDVIFFVRETSAARRVKVVLPKPAAAAVNLSFDEGTRGWTMPETSVNSGYVARAVSDGCHNGGCVEIGRSGERKVEGFAALSQRIDATPYRGKKVRLRAWVRSSLQGDGSSARLYLRVDRPSGLGFFDNMQSRAPKSLPEWTELEITGDVAPDADAVAFGALMVGDGTAWYDDVTLEVVP